MNFDTLRHSKYFDLIYRIGVIIKGLDGLAELIAGIALVISPAIVHMVLSSVVGQANEHHGRTFHFIAEYVARLDNDLAKSGLLFLTIFLIGHGVVKLVLVYCLLRRYVHAYPYAIAVLILFLVYQIYVLIQDPLSIGMWFFTLLDIVIIWLVWGEYKDLQEKMVK
ncbi:MAG: hypothetical protein JWN75_715 [Candidatus Saccharibacteria bacterium]|nr:hypothetical protein [Candidatus Saccharibacteria bacterium]